MAIASWLVHTINVAAPSGVGSDGERTYGAVAAVNARVEAAQRQRYSDARTGAELQADHYIATTTAIGWDDRVWLPGEDPDTDEPHRVIHVDATTDKAGVRTLYEVYL